MSDQDFTKGLEIRREVMGDEFVDRAFANNNSFDAPLQEWVTEHVWGSTWTREGLPRSTRSLVTIAMLAALKCPQELKGHIRGALRNGCSVDEIREVLLHSAVYCGAPAAIEAIRAAKQVIDDWQASQPTAE